LEFSVTNNDVLRRLRYTFHLRDSKVVEIFKFVNHQVTLSQVQDWLLKDDDDNMELLSDIELAHFLNGFIIHRRGKKDGDIPKPESTLTKNTILMKLKIALKLQNDDIQQLLSSTGFTIGKAELTAFFRKPDHKNYRHCKSQFLRNFLQAIQDKHYEESRKNPLKDSASIKDSQPVTKTNQPQSQLQPKPKPHISKGIYINPKATAKKPTGKTLKLKPEDIYKNS